MSNVIQVALVGLPRMQNDVLAGVLAASPGVRVQSFEQLTGDDLSSMAASEAFDAFIARWGSSECGGVSQSLLRANPGLVIIVATPGSPNEFHLHTAHQVKILPASVSPKTLVTEILLAKASRALPSE